VRINDEHSRSRDSKRNGSLPGHPPPANTAATPGDGRLTVRFVLLASVLIIVAACQPTPLPGSITPNVVTSIPTDTSQAVSSPSPAQTEAGQPVATSTPLPSATPLLLSSSSTPPPNEPAREPDIGPADPTSEFPTAPLPLTAYPRPPDDNGLGVHWSTHLYAQSDEATSYFVSELDRLNIKWVKLLVDGLTNRDYDHTIDELVSRDIMPVIRNLSTVQPAL
jgi:hypothetical protein